MKLQKQTKEPITINKKQARQFLLSHHFLLPPRNLSASQILPKLFSHLGCIQFDTINVVGRNADLVLQSRVKNYKPQILDQLLYQDRVLVDGWDKVASIYSTEDWPYFERHRKNMGNHNHLRSHDASKATEKILQRIDKIGPASSLDFKDSSKTDWAWGPTSVARAALEILHAEGKLGIHHRVNTRRHFDLMEKLIPTAILKMPDPNSTDEEYQDWHVMRRIGSMGLASPKSGEHWLGIYGARKASDRNKILKRLFHKGNIALIRVEELDNQDFYVRCEDLPNLLDQPDAPVLDQAAFLAPLDNLLWNRNLIKDIFDFAYTWEVYKPKDKREYGYYVLPVLVGDQLIARVDMKFERKNNSLKLINWWWENSLKITPLALSAIRNCMQEFLNYLDVKTFEVSEKALQVTKIGKIFKDIQ